jgi:hypothetical protein
MGRGGVTDGSTYAFRCPTSVHLEVWMLSCVPPRAAYLCRRIPGAIGCAAITMEPSGLQSSTSFCPPEMIDSTLGLVPHHLSKTRRDDPVMKSRTWNASSTCGATWRS